MNWKAIVHLAVVILCWSGARPLALAQAPGSMVPSGGGIHPAVVRIVAPGDGSVSYGSGTLVAVNSQHGLVITNWHVINEATGQIMVLFPDGFQSAAKVEKTDQDWDLAALAIWRPPVSPVPISRHAPQPGELLTIAGYGSGNYRAVQGACTQYVAPGLKFPYEMVELAATARQGDSGGPIFNRQGELAGVLFGEGNGRTSGSYCGRVQWFMESVVGGKADREAAEAGSQFAAQSKTLPNPPWESAASTGETSEADDTASAMAMNDDNNAPLSVDEESQPSSAPAHAASWPRHDEIDEAPRATLDTLQRPEAQPATAPLALSWEEFAGHGPLEQGKTILAMLGGIAGIGQLLRILGRSQPPSKPSAPEIA